MDRSILYACLALLLAGTACSVREDRGPCPCYLQVSFADPDAAGPVEFLGWDAGTLFHDRTRIEECRPAWIKPVRKGWFVLAACQGIGSAVLDGHQVRIPVNCQADSLYACFREVDATGDLAAVEVTLRKQFATVFLDIRKPAKTVQACRFQVDGNSCGFDVLDYSPAEGPFHFEPRPAPGQEVVTFRIPRQQDDALSVTIRPDDFPETRFPLGEYIRQLGYNWHAEELQDIYVAIDLARARVDVQVAGWEPGATFPLLEL